MSTPTSRTERTPVPGDAISPHTCLRRRGARGHLGWSGRIGALWWGLVLTGLLLSACAASLTQADRAVLRIEGARVTIVAPPGLCVDPASPDVRRQGGFLLISDCTLFAANPGGVPRLNGVIGVTVSTSGLDEDFAALEGFLTGPGRAALSRSGRGDLVTVLETRRQQDTLALKVRDPGPSPVPGTAPEFWRIFFMAGPRLASGALSQFEGGGMTDAEALAWLDGLATATATANSAPASPVTEAAGSG